MYVPEKYLFNILYIKPQTIAIIKHTQLDKFYECLHKVFWTCMI